MRNLFSLKSTVNAVLVSAALLSFVAGPGVRTLRADDCQATIARDDHKLHEAIEHHGANSKQADHYRHALNKDRERCWEANKKWWDEDEHKWHTDHDWDDHDHNH